MIVHIGYHKTASSWLQRRLFRIPETGFRTIKKKKKDDHPVRALVRARSLDFDAAAFRSQFERLLQPVREAGLIPVVSYERFSGHPVSGGYDAKEIADRLHAVFPEAKVLMVLREQRSAIVSCYKQYVLGGGTSALADFLQPPASNNMSVPAFDLTYFEYDRLLRYYRSLFGETSVLAIPFEQFLSKPAEFVTAIGRHGGRPIPPDVVAALPFDEVVRPTVPAAKIEAERRLNRHSRSEFNPTLLFESATLSRLAKLVDSAATMASPRVRRTTDATLLRTVTTLARDRYTQSNRATAELTGIDLGAYGWVI